MPPTFAEILDAATQLFNWHSVPPSTQQMLQRLQTFVRLSTCSGLQNISHAVGHRTKIRRIRWSFCRRDEIRKMGVAPFLSRFRLVGRHWVLLKRPFSIAEVLLGPRKYHGLEIVAAIEHSTDIIKIKNPYTCILKYGHSNYDTTKAQQKQTIASRNGKVWWSFFAPPRIYNLNWKVYSTDIWLG